MWLLRQTKGVLDRMPIPNVGDHVEEILAGCRGDDFSLAGEFCKDGCLVRLMSVEPLWRRPVSGTEDPERTELPGISFSCR